MFSCFFVAVIRQSIQTLCPVFSFKEYFRCFQGSVNRVLNRKDRETSPDKICPKDSGGSHWRASSLHVQNLALQNPFLGSFKSLRGAKYFLRETMNSPRGTNNSLRRTEHFLRETMNSPRGASTLFREAKHYLREITNSPRGTNIFFRDTKYKLNVRILANNDSFDLTQNTDTTLKAVPRKHNCDTNTSKYGNKQPDNSPVVTEVKKIRSR